MHGFCKTMQRTDLLDATSFNGRVYYALTHIPTHTHANMRSLTRLHICTRRNHPLD
eukprot:m.29421 g.29421  ORF g.29421 m.29421 type:complete len:56 (-) comp9160_c1_seq1:4604-4771(-)